MKEYKIAKGWAIFIYLFAALFIGVFGWVLTLPFSDRNFLSNSGWILITIAVAIIILMVFGVIDAYKGRLKIYEDRIVSISTFSNRELEFSNIKGFTVNDNYIFIEPNNDTQKRIKISKYIGGYNEILFWLSQTFTDLEQQNAIREEREILNDENYGCTKEIREEKLRKARQTSKIINWAASITAAWTILYPIPYQYCILAAIIIPIVALFAVKFSGGLIRFDESKGSTYPSVVYAIIYPSLGLMLRAILDYEILDYSNVWLTTTIITLIFFTLLLIKQRELTFKKKIDYLTVVSLALLLFIYSFGTVIHLNCYYDNSEAEFFTAKVLHKRISSGKTTTHYLELSNWGQQRKVDEVSVGKDFYNRTAIGEEVNIYFRKGILEIPWFIVTDE